MTDTLNEFVAANIRAEVGRRRMSQQDFADLIRVTRPTAAAILNGTTELTLKRVESIADALNVEPAKLLNE